MPARPSIQAMVDRLEHELAQHGTPERAAGAKAYLKSDLEFLGADIPHVRAQAKAFLAEVDLDRGHLLALTKALWKRPFFETRALAVALLEKKAKRLDSRDLEVLETLTRESKTWALSDWIAIHVVGVILRAEPDGKRLDAWAKDDDFWVRRLALICQRNDFSKGRGDWPRFVKHADRMISEKEFFIRKAIGWMLRERGKTRPDDVVEFVQSRRERMSGVTYREATRNLPADFKAALG